MAVPVGEQRGNKLYTRCEECGDSTKHLDMGHLIIYLDTGYAHCTRCGHHEKLGIREFMEYAAQANMNEVRDFQPRNLELKGDYTKVTNGFGLSMRFSVVERFFIDPESDTEMWESRLADGEVVGYHLRRSQIKFSKMLGKRALGFRGKMIPYGVTVRVVEGPFDAIENIDVCCFGMPAPLQIQELSFRDIILCPDGDIWEDPRKYVSFFRAPVLEKANVLYVEKIEHGLDPDEVPVEERKIISWVSIMEEWWSLKAQLKRQFVQLG